MRNILITLLCLCLVSFVPAMADEAETVIVLSDDAVTVNGAPIGEDADAAVYLAHHVETHKDVPKDLKELSNRVVTICEAGVYRISGTASDLQIAIRAAEDDEVRIILDGVDITCRTAPAIVCHSAYDSRTANEYGFTIELAADSVNSVTGSHTTRIKDDDVKFDGAIESLVSLGFEGSGSLNVEADNEGVEVKFGHLTFNGGVFHINACDDPLNVSEDNVGTLTFNDGYLFSSVKPEKDGEGDGMDSNGYIVFNGGAAINLAHPTSQDSGIDSDMGSFINGGLIVGAGNMYDPIDSASEQLFMMLEFSEATDDLVVVTDANDQPVFAYDFPYAYMYIAFSSPELTEGVYHVYLGGEITGEQQDGLYTRIDSYIPGTQMQHGGGTASRGGMTPPDAMGGAPDRPDDMQPGGMNGSMPSSLPNNLDLNQLLENVDLNQLLEGKNLNQLLTGFSPADLFTEEQIREYFGDIDMDSLFDLSDANGRQPFDGMGGMGDPRGLQSSADIATTDFLLSKSNTGFTNISAVVSAK